MSDKNCFAEKLTLQAVVILLLASCFYLYEFYIQMAPSVMQPELMRTFAIDATKVGILSGCFYLAYTPLQLVSGLLLDRYSTRVLLTIFCLIFTFGVLLFGYAHNLYIAAIARFIMGSVASCAFISVLHLTARWAPAMYFAFFAGITEMMGAFGGYGGTKHIALLLKHFDWRTTMFGFFGIGLILTLLIVTIVRNQPTVGKCISMQNSNRSIWTDLKTVLHNKETWTIGIYSFFIWAPILGFGLWGIEFMCISRHFDKITSANIVSWIWLGVAFASPTIGWLSDFIGRRCILMTICAFAGTCAITAIIFLHNVSTPILYLLTFTIGFASAGQTLTFALIKDNHSPQTNSTANGFNNMVVVAGGLLFQPLIGKILDLHWQGIIQNGVFIYSAHSYQIAFLTLPLCYLIATITSMFFIKETRCIAKWSIT